MDEDKIKIFIKNFKLKILFENSRSIIAKI